MKSLKRGRGLLYFSSVCNERRKVKINTEKKTAFGMLHRYAVPQLIPLEDAILHAERIEKFIREKGDTKCQSKTKAEGKGAL